MSKSFSSVLPLILLTLCFCNPNENSEKTKRLASTAIPLLLSEQKASDELPNYDFIESLNPRINGYAETSYNDLGIVHQENLGGSDNVAISIRALQATDPLVIDIRTKKTFSGGNIFVKLDGVAISGNLSRADSKSLRFISAEPMSPNRIYSVTVSDMISLDTGEIFDAFSYAVYSRIKDDANHFNNAAATANCGGTTTCNLNYRYMIFNVSPLFLSACNYLYIDSMLYENNLFGGTPVTIVAESFQPYLNPDPKRALIIYLSGNTTVPLSHQNPAAAQFDSMIIISRTSGASEIGYINSIYDNGSIQFF